MTTHQLTTITTCQHTGQSNTSAFIIVGEDASSREGTAGRQEDDELVTVPLDLKVSSAFTLGEKNGTLAAVEQAEIDATEDVAMEELQGEADRGGGREEKKADNDGGGGGGGSGGSADDNDEEDEEDGTELMLGNEEADGQQGDTRNEDPVAGVDSGDDTAPTNSTTGGMVAFADALGDEHSSKKTGEVSVATSGVVYPPASTIIFDGVKLTFLEEESALKVLSNDEGEDGDGNQAPLIKSFIVLEEAIAAPATATAAHSGPPSDSSAPAVVGLSRFWPSSWLPSMSTPKWLWTFSFHNKEGEAVDEDSRSWADDDKASSPMMWLRVSAAKDRTLSHVDVEDNNDDHSDNDNSEVVEGADEEDEEAPLPEPANTSSAADDASREHTTPSMGGSSWFSILFRKSAKQEEAAALESSEEFVQETHIASPMTTTKEDDDDKNDPDTPPELSTASTYQKQLLIVSETAGSVNEQTMIVGEEEDGRDKDAGADEDEDEDDEAPLPEPSKISSYPESVRVQKPSLDDASWFYGFFRTASSNEVANEAEAEEAVAVVDEEMDILNLEPATDEEVQKWIDLNPVNYDSEDEDDGHDNDGEDNNNDDGDDDEGEDEDGTEGIVFKFCKYPPCLPAPKYEEPAVESPADDLRAELTAVESQQYAKDDVFTADVTPEEPQGQWPYDGDLRALDQLLLPSALSASTEVMANPSAVILCLLVVLVVARSCFAIMRKWHAKDRVGRAASNPKSGEPPLPTSVPSWYRRVVLDSEVKKNGDHPGVPPSWHDDDHIALVRAEKYARLPAPTPVHRSDSAIVDFDTDDSDDYDEVSSKSRRVVVHKEVKEDGDHPGVPPTWHDDDHIALLEAEKASRIPTPTPFHRSNSATVEFDTDDSLGGEEDYDEGGAESSEQKFRSSVPPAATSPRRLVMLRGAPGQRAAGAKKSSESPGHPGIPPSWRDDDDEHLAAAAAQRTLEKRQQATLTPQMAAAPWTLTPSSSIVVEFDTDQSDIGDDDAEDYEAAVPGQSTVRDGKWIRARHNVSGSDSGSDSGGSSGGKFNGNGYGHGDANPWPVFSVDDEFAAPPQQQNKEQQQQQQQQQQPQQQLDSPDKWAALRAKAEEFSADPQRVLQLADIHPEDFGALASESLSSTKSWVLAAVRRNGGALQHASRSLRDDRQVVAAAVAQNGGALVWASKALRADKSICLAAVKTWPDALKLAAPEIRDDETVVLAAVERDGRAMSHASRRLRGLPEEEEEDEQEEAAATARSIPNRSGADARFGSASALLVPPATRSFAVRAVSASGHALKFLGPALRGDETVALAAFRADRLALRYASPSLRASPVFMRSAARRCGRTALRFAFVPPPAEDEGGGVVEDLAVVMTAVGNDGKALKYVAKTLRDDEDVVLAAVASDGRALKYATRRLRCDRAFVSQCCAVSGWALHFAAKELREDPELRRSAAAHLPRTVAAAAVSSARRHRHSPQEVARILPLTQKGEEDKEKTAGEEHWESFDSLSLAIRLGVQEIASPSWLVPPAIDEEEDEKEEHYYFEETEENRGDKSGDVGIVNDVEDGRYGTLTKAEVTSYASWLQQTAAFDTSG